MIANQIKLNYFIYYVYSFDDCQIFYYFYCSLFIELADGKKTSTHLGKNRLDKERTKMLFICVVSFFSSFLISVVCQWDKKPLNYV